MQWKFNSRLCENLDEFSLQKKFSGIYKRSTRYRNPCRNQFNKISRPKNQLPKTFGRQQIIKVIMKLFTMSSSSLTFTLISKILSRRFSSSAFNLATSLVDFSLSRTNVGTQAGTKPIVPNCNSINRSCERKCENCSCCTSSQFVFSLEKVNSDFAVNLERNSRVRSFNSFFLILCNRHR